MQYSFNESDASVPRMISGASLAQTLRHLPPPARACWGADIVDGKITITAPTARSVALTTNVNPSYLFTALRLTPEQRELVKRDVRPLILPTPPAKPIPAPSIEVAWGTTSYGEQVCFAAKHASELMRMIDYVTAPAISEKPFAAAA